MDTGFFVENLAAAWVDQATADGSESLLRASSCPFMNTAVPSVSPKKWRQKGVPQHDKVKHTTGTTSYDNMQLIS